MKSPFVQIVDHQLQYNDRKSLFFEYADGSLFPKPSSVTVRFLRNESATTNDPFPNTEQMNHLASYITKRVTDDFLKTNQFVNFKKKDYEMLNQINLGFIERVRDAIKNGEFFSDDSIQTLFNQRYRQLKAFLIYTNGKEIFKKYQENPYVFEIVCAEYGAEFQIQMMNLNVDTMMEPVLDIGCGQDSKLVNHLRSLGIQAFGIDRAAEQSEYISNKNWIETSFKEEYWGTIISHMAFSNHFGHHFFRKDGEYKAYMMKFTEILKSLKRGGSFIFSPSIPFLQQVLADRNEYCLISSENETFEILKKTSI